MTVLDMYDWVSSVFRKLASLSPKTTVASIKKHTATEMSPTGTSGPTPYPKDLKSEANKKVPTFKQFREPS